MHRRALLAAVGTGLGSLAGCAQTSPEADTPAMPPVDTKPGATPPPSPATTEKTDGFSLTASVTSLELVDGYADVLTVRFRNGREDSIRFNPFSWSLRSWTGEEWYEWEQRASGNGFVDVEVGGSHEWTLTEAVEAIGHEPPTRSGWYALELVSVAVSPVQFRLVEA